MSLKKNELVAAANKFFQQGRWDKAIERYGKVLELEPKNINVLNMLGDCYLGRGDNQNALEMYAQAADTLIEQGLNNKAIAIFKKVSRIFPDNCEIYEKLANCYVQSGLVGEANGIYLKMGELYSKENKTKEALVAYKKIAELNPDNILVRLKLAEMFGKLGIPQEGVAEFLRIADKYKNEKEPNKQIQLLMRGKKVFPKSPEFYERLASIYYGDGKFKDAIVELREALSLQETTSLLRLLAASSQKEKDVELARKSIDKLEALDPAYSDLKRLKALQAGLEGDVTVAFATMDELNDSLFAQSKLNEVAANIDDLAFHIGSCPEILQLQFKLYYPQEDKEEQLINVAEQLAGYYSSAGQTAALNEINEKIQDKYPYRRELRAIVVGETPEATAVTEDISEPAEAAPVVETAELPAAADEEEGMISFAEDEPVEAEEAPAEIDESAIEEVGMVSFAEEPAVVEEIDEPVSAEAAPLRSVSELLEEASSLAQQGMFEEAEEAYQAVIAQDAASTEAYYQLGLVHRRIDNLEAAVTDFQKYLEIDDSNVRILSSLGEVLEELDRKEEAIPYFEKALEIDSGLLSVLRNLERLYTDLGEDEKLQSIRDSIAQLSRDSEAPTVEMAEPFTDEPEELEPETLEPDYDSEPEVAETPEVAEIASLEEEVVAQTVEDVFDISEPEVVPPPASEPDEFEFDTGVVEKRRESAVEEAVEHKVSDTDMSEIDLGEPAEQVASPEAASAIEVEPVEKTEPDKIASRESVLDVFDRDDSAAEELFEFSEESEEVLEALEQARIFFNHHLYQKAIDECHRILRIDSENIEAQQLLLQIKEKGAGTKEGKAPVLKAAEDESSTRESIFDQLIDDDFATPVLRESELDEISLDEIIADFKTGVIEEPEGEGEDYENHFNLGLAFRDMGLFDEAIGEFQIAAKKEEHYLRCCEMLGECYLEKGIFSLAIEELKNGLEVATKINDKLKFKYRLAIAYEKSDEADKAIELYQEVIAEDEKYEEVVTRLDLALKARHKKNISNSRISYI